MAAGGYRQADRKRQGAGCRESRVLREKEFIQLKKDRVIIHTGHLAGKLLVDVLMADLMENTDSIQSPALAAAA